MKKLYLLIFILLLSHYYIDAQTYLRSWISFNQDTSARNLTLSDMAVDSNGYSYLAGYELDAGDQYYETHLCLYKINAAGTLQWKRNFNNLKDSIDAAIAVTVDSAGYVYVTGKRVDTFCNICTYNSKISDIITMKYDRKGNLLWLNRYHDSDFILAAPSDIVVAANGNIIITGNESKYDSKLGTYSSKLLLQKINNNGATVWIKKMGNVVGNTACFDSRNNIIVGAASNPDNIYQTQKPMVLKFSSVGNLLWSNVFDEANKNGKIYFVQCDAVNNIYANGQTDTIAFYNNPRIITIKYSGSGSQKWFRKEANNTTTAPHFYGDFKTDAAGNSYSTGFISKSGTDDDWLIVKYNGAGEKKWSNYFDDFNHGSDKPVGLVIDKKGYTHVSGYVYAANGNYAIATAHYNPKGVLTSSDIYQRGTHSNGFATGIGVDRDDNVYTGGALGFYNSPYPGFAVIKYYFTQNITADKPEQNINANKLKLFPNPVGEVLNIQFTSLTSTGKYNFLIHDVTGNLILSKPINSNDKIINITADVHQLKQGIYTAGISDGFNTVSQSFIKE